MPGRPLHEQVRRHRPSRKNPNHRTPFRVKGNVISSQLLALDCDTQDERSTFYDLLRPWTEPIWVAERDFFEIGDPVVAQVGDRVIGRGKIVRYREKEHWEFQLDSVSRVWFAKALLRREL